MTILDRIKRDIDGFHGRFFYDAESGDIGWIAKDCDERTCDCEEKLNADGDQDCSHSLSDWEGEDHINEPIVRILNAVPALIAEVERLQVFETGMTALRERAKSFGMEPGALLSRFLHVDAEFDKMEADRDRLAAECERLTKERDGLLTATRGCPSCGFEYSHESPGLDLLAVEREDRRKAEAAADRMRGVYEAAVEWSESFGELSKRLPPHVHKLRAAVDAATKEKP